MTKLRALDQRLLRAAATAVLGAEGDTPDEDTAPDAEGEEEETLPAAKKAKKAKKVGKSTAEGEDEDTTAEGDEDEDTSASEDDEDESAEGEDEDPDAEGEDEDEVAEGEDEEVPASRKSKARASSGERARIAAIVNSPLAAGREGLASYMAFSTGFSAKQALGVLKHSPKTKATESLRSRMASVPNPDIRTGSAKTGAKGDDEKAAIAAVLETAKLAGLA